MEKRWPPCALYLFILTYRVAGQLEGTIINPEAVRAFPGNDVTLECSILSADWIHLTQTQWSKIDDTPPSRIAVYNPMYGITYLPFSKTSYNYSWNLYLRNVSLSLSGQYECAFVLYCCCLDRLLSLGLAVV
uniref:Ig-like domain-containing protein n=1 Tax=Chelonoidis abingdonii TaxID=106734 RepID=A0A8C0G9Y9_CHEAB